MDDTPPPSKRPTKRSRSYRPSPDRSSQTNASVASSSTRDPSFTISPSFPVLPSTSPSSLLARLDRELPDTITTRGRSTRETAAKRTSAPEEPPVADLTRHLSMMSPAGESSYTDVSNALLSSRERNLERELAAERKKRIQAESALKNNRRKLYAIHKELRDKHAALEDSHSRLKKAFQASTSTHESEVKAVKDELEESRRVLEDKKQQLESRCAQLQEDLETMEERCRQRDSELNLRRETMNELISRIKELEEGNREELARVSSLASSQVNISRDEEIHRQLHDTLGEMKRLEVSNSALTRENDLLKRGRANAERLREEIHSLEVQLTAARGQAERLPLVEDEYQHLQAERDSWLKIMRQYAGEGQAITGPSQLVQQLQQARLEVASMAEREGRVRADLAGAQERIYSLTKKHEEDVKYQKDLEGHLEAERIKGRRRERGRVLAIQECDFIREQLRSYQVEEAGMEDEEGTKKEDGDEEKVESEEEEKIKENGEGKKEEPLTGAAEEGDVKTHKNIKTKKEMRDEKLIKQLEGLVAEYREQLHSLAEETTTPDGNHVETGSSGHADSELHNRIDLLEKELEEKGDTCRRWEGQVRSLEGALAQCEWAVSRGEYDWQRTRILQLEDNPTSRAMGVRKARLRALQKENMALLAQIKTMGSTTSADSHLLDENRMGDEEGDEGESERQSEEARDLVPRESLLNLQSQLERAEEEGRMEGKKLLRLRQVFRNKAIEYREAVYSLLGYKLDFLPNGRVRLTSAYASSSEQCFDFESGAGDEGTMELVGAGDAAWRLQVDPGTG
ncbi:spindle assembly checkpoint component Mad1 [Piptocephalis cylindrospora]|uniref:Spindle assembly checkpoint component MAD1 n=1 Tax=Piptocephalis cylindrospora TaxID=1907219 RepID=A0A4P9Y1S0_9FUNG|nr:spindle assembly checkpoint component Mad1 [Piptocephalis cylindrospora]|eukprot:RKP12806.1 spindle assembly checkpoint component Mad1 [Piptocephalis cylindrospora]